MTLNPTLVFDTSPFNHFARAGELETLALLVKDFRCVTTRAVIGELQNGVAEYPQMQQVIELDWISVVPCDDLEVLYLYGTYLNRLGNLERNAGEATVLAWAEHNGAIAYIDDQVACDLGRSRGVKVHRTLQLVINAYRARLLTEDRSQRLIEQLADTDARFPRAAVADLFQWARTQDPPLLDG